MKNILLKNTFIASLITALLMGINTQAQDFDVSDYKMLYKFSTTKNNDNSRLLEVSFTARNKKNKKDKIPVFAADINFINFLGDKEILLGRSKTSKEGIALLTIPENHNYLTDRDGNINLAAVFEATDVFDEQIEEIRIKNLQLKLHLTEIDSVKTVLIKAFTKDSSGTELPVEDLDVNIAIGSMISKMILEEGTTENGELEFVFPTDIPGDVNGNITVYSIVEDHEEFGNVNQLKTIKWGVFQDQSTKEKNMLWSSAAPIWMYIVLTIMLVGVWVNYLYTIINLFKLKKECEIFELNSEG